MAQILIARRNIGELLNVMHAMECEGVASQKRRALQEHGIRMFTAILDKKIDEQLAIRNKVAKQEKALEKLEVLSVIV